MQKRQRKAVFSSVEDALPSFRVTEQVSAFEHVGLDYLGPLYNLKKVKSLKEMYRSPFLLVQHHVSLTLRDGILAKKKREI